MLNFRKVYEFLFSSFRISRDTELVGKLLSDGVAFAVIVKRAWLYGAFSSFLLLPIALITVANVYLLGKHFAWNTTGTVLATLLAANVAYTVVSSVRFLYEYRKFRQNALSTVSTRVLAEDLKKGDAIFSSLFNQLQTNFFFFIGIVVFYVFHVTVVSGFSTGIWAMIDIVCIVLQLLALRKFVSNMINLEMDFTVAVPGKIYFVNQKGMYAEVQTLESDKIKTIKSSYPNFVASFFGYGNLEIMTEGDLSGLGTIVIEYVENPEETVENVNALLSGKFVPAENIHNAYLKRIISELGGEPKGAEFRDAVKKFLADYESQIRTDYEAGDDATKDEIEKIYADFANR
jgi:hypothetical protein